jgi:hypothetical protein
MSAYLQMGHDSENLVGVSGLEAFAGVVLSPVNCTDAELTRNVPEFRKKGIQDIILDPQLYCPKSQRGNLLNQPYFPKDFDTADPSSATWWAKLVKPLADYAKRLNVEAVCSPAILPKKWSPEYYVLSAESYGLLADQLRGSAVRPVITVCVSLKELAETDDVLRIASIVTSRSPGWSYIVVEAEIEPRREIAEAQCLSGLMLLVAMLERAGTRVLVSHCSSDILLMKAAGASHCASGKFFNLRRFSRSRFDDQQDGGGGQLPYWFEHSLLAFLREADIPRLRRSGFEGFIACGQSDNVFGKAILEQFANNPRKAWLGLSWRQYLAWFAAAETALTGPSALTTVNLWLLEAEKRWEQLQDKAVLFEESRNDGRWIRPWRQAVADFNRPLG